MEERYKEIGYKITGACFDVANNLGCGFLEKVYKKALAWELEQRGLKVEVEKQIKIRYKDVDLDLDYYADIVVNNEVIIELKAVSGLCNEHRAQIQNYLHATRIGYGMLVNFGVPRIEIERFVNTTGMYAPIELCSDDDDI